MFAPTSRDHPLIAIKFSRPVFAGFSSSQIIAINGGDNEYQTYSGFSGTTIGSCGMPNGYAGMVGVRDDRAAGGNRQVILGSMGASLLDPRVALDRFRQAAAGQRGGVGQAGPGLRAQATPGAQSDRSGRRRFCSRTCRSIGIGWKGKFGYTGTMAKVVGKIPEAARLGLLGSIAARLNDAARLKAEFESGEGVRRLLPVLEALPDGVTVVVRPTLGFFQADFGVVGPGRVLVINTLHWQGRIKLDEKDLWLGQGGSVTVQLGRPDRRAKLFAERLEYSGNARGFQVEPLVIRTLGAIEFDGPLVAPMIGLEETAAYLAARFPDGVKGFDHRELVDVLL